MTVKVLDALCGSGKTRAMFRQMAMNPDKKYIFVTPLLSEAEDRVPEQMRDVYKDVNGVTQTPSTKVFYCPRKSKDRSKRDHLKMLLEEGKNVSTTHKMFSMLTNEIIRLLIDQNYVLVIDEAIECVGTISEYYNKSDVQALITGDFVVTDPAGERGRLLWREDKYPNHDGKYALVRAMCNIQALYSFEDKFLMVEYPPTLLKGLQEVYVLTYMFRASDMRCWLDLNGIPYEYIDKKEWGVEREEELLEAAYYSLDVLKHRNLDKLMDAQRRQDLSLSWFNRSLVKDTKPYKTAMESLVNTSGAKRGEVYWTTFQEYEKRMRGKGYTVGPNPETPAWIAKNTRATNAYKDFHMSMFACNSYRNPLICRYLKHHDVDYAYDEWSTSELVQFLFRGRIRTLQPQKVVILSKRMLELFERWRKSLI